MLFETRGVYQQAQIFLVLSKSNLPLSESPLIEVRTIKRANLNGGTLIDGFPSGGLANSISSMCFMKSLRNELISVLDSSAFPPLSMIYDGIANFPARIYANKDLKVAFLISELNLDQTMYYAVSRTIFQWAMDNGCKLVISSGTISTEESKRSPKEYELQNVYGVASTKKAKEKMKNIGIVLELHSGSVNGIPALLLNEGARRNFDVIVLLGKIIKGSSEFRSAAAISEAIMKLVPGLSCDIRDLITRAKTIEQDLMKVRAGQKNSTINLYR
jgi:uncharacterized protein